MKNKLDNEEKEMLNDYNNNEYIEITDMEKEIEKNKEYAKETFLKFLKNKRINIRISQRDLEYIQRRALEEGIPYQTLIASLIHKYITGKLVEKDKVLINK